MCLTGRVQILVCLCLQPIFNDLEARFKERTQEFDTMKRNVVGKIHLTIEAELSLNRFSHNTPPPCISFNAFHSITELPIVMALKIVLRWWESFTLR